MELGRGFIIIGLIFLTIGLFLVFREQIPWLRNLGRLPGDIAIEREGFKFYFPLMTSLLLSLLLSLIAYWFRR